MLYRKIRYKITHLLSLVILFIAIQQTVSNNVPRESLSQRRSQSNYTGQQKASILQKNTKSIASSQSPRTPASLARPLPLYRSPKSRSSIYRFFAGFAERVYIDSVIDYEMTTIFPLFLYILWNELPYKMYGGLFLLYIRQVITIGFNIFIRSVISTSLWKAIVYRFVFSLFLGFYNKFCGLLVLVYQNLLFSAHISSYRRASWKRRLNRMITDPLNLFIVVLRNFRSLGFTSMLPAIVSFWDSTVATVFDHLINVVSIIIAWMPLFDALLSFPALYIFFSRFAHLIVILPALNALRHIFKRYRLPASVYLSIFDEFFESLLVVRKSPTSRASNRQRDKVRSKLQLLQAATPQDKNGEMAWEFLNNSSIVLFFKALFQVCVESGFFYGLYRTFFSRTLTLAITVPLEYIFLSSLKSIGQKIVPYLPDCTKISAMDMLVRLKTHAMEFFIVIQEWSISFTCQVKKIIQILSVATAADVQSFLDQLASGTVHYCKSMLNSIYVFATITIPDVVNYYYCKFQNFFISLY
jgi:hypothetical protein